jgi:hypothetical protein
VSGTPVISTANGCLAEITPRVGKVLQRGETITRERARELIHTLPTSDEVRDTALREWGHVKIARQYADVYQEVIRDRHWC